MTGQACLYVGRFAVTGIAMGIVARCAGQPVPALLETPALFQTVRLEQIGVLFREILGRHFSLGPVAAAANLVDTRSACLAKLFHIRTFALAHSGNVRAAGAVA